jgi:CMP-N-acetylneuraminic acid synthetase
LIADKRIATVITARGGSKGLPRKNLRSFRGKPLIGWTIEAALRSRYVDRVIVSSESQEIIAAAERFGAEAPFVRPQELAGDLSRQEDAVLHAMRWVTADEEPYDYLMMLTPTHPLRDAEEIDAVVERFAQHPRARSMLTVIPCEHSPLQTGTLPEDLSMANFMPADIRFKNRQELPQYYRLSASVALAHWNHFIAHESFLTPETYAFVTSPRRGLDIDTEADLLLAELYISHPAAD